MLDQCNHSISGHKLVNLNIAFPCRKHFVILSSQRKRQGPRFNVSSKGSTRVMSKEFPFWIKIVQISFSLKEETAAPPIFIILSVFVYVYVFVCVCVSVCLSRFNGLCLGCYVSDFDETQQKCCTYNRQIKFKFHENWFNDDVYPVFISVYLFATGQILRQWEIMIILCLDFLTIE